MEIYPNSLDQETYCWFVNPLKIDYRFNTISKYQQSDFVKKKKKKIVDWLY
jgi:hypothetical protein